MTCHLDVRNLGIGAMVYLFFTRDFATVKAIAGSIVIMHKGRVVRSGPKSQVLAPPFDDYTGLLLKSDPEMKPGWLETALAKQRMVSASD
ncbi:hypothetical protein M3P21_21530 [Ruegeria sp. 2012CJ41-6]|uniref:Uncharacterized protein n=1 Tax=Ruegeria spongiae TaxID=2942209 RepID=A0ABT0Q8A1_9RHOB|nr:hypothetical protein [Ruegeria spongiae]MCL6286096.1 hypothetical protein [Ruegeria spongiae]